MIKKDYAFTRYIKHNGISVRFYLFLIVFLFLPSLVINDYFGKGYEYLVMLVGFPFVLYVNYFKKDLFQATEETLIRFSGLIFLVILTGFFYQNPELTRFAPTLEGYSKTVLLPLFLLPILYFIKFRSIGLLASMLAIGAMISFVMTVYAISHGVPRGGGGVHGAPIIFGDLAMLYGVLLFILAVYFHTEKYFYWLIFFGALGVLSSLLSGSRGGWIVLFTLPFFLIPFLPKKYRTRVSILGGCVFILIITAIALLDNPIKSRVLLAFSEIQLILSDEAYMGGSLGSRLEFWRLAWLAFLSNPINGIGVGEFYAFKMHLVEMGKVPEHLARYKHTHNEYLGILSGMGLIGVLVYGTFFVWLWKFFNQAIHSNFIHIKYLGILGIATIVCYFDFSLSESFLSSDLGGGAFYFLITIYIYLINLYRNEAKIHLERHEQK